jgi:hypothetical protein
VTQYPPQPEHNPQPAPGSVGPPPAGPPDRSAAAREIVALLLLLAVAAQMFASLVGLAGRASLRLAVLGAWGDFLGFSTLLLIGLAVAIGVGSSPGPRARTIGTAVVVLLAIALVFGVLLGLPAIGIVSNGLLDSFARFVVFLSTLAMYAALVLYVRSVLAEVPGVPLFGRTPAGRARYGSSAPSGPPPQYGQPQQYGQAPVYGQPQQYGQAYPQSPPTSPPGASPPPVSGAHPFARPGHDRPGRDQEPAPPDHEGAGE